MSATPEPPIPAKDDSAHSLHRLVKRHYRRCNWMMRAKNWNDCGRKAIKVDPTTQLCYCDKHAHNVGCFPRLVPLNEKLNDAGPVT